MTAPEDAQALAERLVGRMLERDTFSAWLGLEVVEIRPGACTVRMRVREEMLNGFRVCHGGVTFSLADSALAFACNTHGRLTMSIENSITYPVAVQPGELHMHMRGKAMTLEAINLDNTVTVISSVDHFDFGWHVAYLYADDEAPLLPAGTILHMTGVHDNTGANKKNPDPNVWAGYGERSVDDMLQVWLNVVYLDEAEFNRLVAERKAKQGQKTSTSQQQQQ